MHSGFSPLAKTGTNTHTLQPEPIDPSVDTTVFVSFPSLVEQVTDFKEEEEEKHTRLVVIDSIVDFEDQSLSQSHTLCLSIQEQPRKSNPARAIVAKEKPPLRDCHHQYHHHWRNAHTKRAKRAQKKTKHNESTHSVTE